MSLNQLLYPRPRGILAVVAAAAVLVTVLSVGRASAATPAGNPSAAQFERDFLPETIDHHFMGVAMGRVCIDRSDSRRLGDICTGIVVNQSSEIVRLRDDFLLDWYGVEKHPAMTAEDRRMLRNLSRLRGRRFDVALSRMFIEHHKVQIARSRACVSQAEHHKLKHVCMDQIETQSSEIKQFRRVLG